LPRCSITHIEFAIEQGNKKPGAKPGFLQLRQINFHSFWALNQARQR
jgi:hypothetical protein